MPQVRAAASGNIMATLSGYAYRDATTRQVKTQLARLWPHVGRFRMRLLQSGRVLGEEETPFDEKEGREPVVECLFVPKRLPTGHEVDMLIRACGTLNSMALEMLLMKGIYPNFVVRDQRHRLHNILSVAVTKESAQQFGGLGRLHFPVLTEMLLEAHGNVNLAGSLGRTPLFVAAELGFERAVSLLLEHRANPDAKEEMQGECPIHVAARGKHAEVVRLLVDAAADVGVRRMNDGFTHGEDARELAEQVGAADVVALLSG